MGAQDLLLTKIMVLHDGGMQPKEKPPGTFDVITLISDYEDDPGSY